MTRGERIAERRKSQGLTQVDLAEAIGESKQTIYKYENNIVTNIPLPKLEAIAKVLHCLPEELAGWVKETPVPKLTPVQQQAWDMIQGMSDEDLAKFVAMGKIMLGEK